MVWQGKEQGRRQLCFLDDKSYLLYGCYKVDIQEYIHDNLL